MRHVSLTCVNHPELRWHCKSIAVNSDGVTARAYNGARRIFFSGSTNNEWPHRHADECSCSPGDLRIAPDDPFYTMTPAEIKAAIDAD
jgi:hypothetical protein